VIAIEVVLGAPLMGLVLIIGVIALRREG